MCGNFSRRCKVDIERLGGCARPPPPRRGRAGGLSRHSRNSALRRWTAPYQAVKVSSASVPLPHAAVMSRAIASSCAPVLAADMAAVMLSCIGPHPQGRRWQKALRAPKRRSALTPKRGLWEDQPAKIDPALMGFEGHEAGKLRGPCLYDLAGFVSSSITARRMRVRLRRQPPPDRPLRQRDSPARGLLARVPHRLNQPQPGRCACRLAWICRERDQALPTAHAEGFAGRSRSGLSNSTGVARSRRCPANSLRSESGRRAAMA